MRRQQRRISAYGVCQDPSGAVLLTRAAGPAGPGTWLLPGGGIKHGEHPADAVVRAVAAETGLAVEVVRVRDVAAEVLARPPGLEHTDAVIYDLAVTSGQLRPGAGGSADPARWVSPADLPTLPLSGLAAYALGLAPAPSHRLPPPANRSPAPPRRRRGQRFAVYGLVTDPADRVLLTLISDGYPGAGKWHLPGGGTDFGEQPVDALQREIIEESGQQARIGRPLEVTHRHHTTRRGPMGLAVDWHAVRAIYEVTVAEPTTPQVLDAGGSTADAGWFTREQVRTLPLTDVAAGMLVPVV